MVRHLVRAVASFATGAVLTLGFAPGALAGDRLPAIGYPAVVAAAQARDYCAAGDTNSVTVVVDFSGVGGGIDIRCSSGSTGQQALANSFGYSEIASQPGFICQIDGAPASDCQSTPPGSAYWSYWQAAPGGGWAYSSRGFSSSRVKPGGFEGWAFGSGGSPGIDPVLPAAPEPAPPAAEPEQPAARAPAAPQPEQQPPNPGADAGTPDAGSGKTTDLADPATETTDAGSADPATDPAAAAAAAAEAAAAAAAAQAAAESADAVSAAALAAQQAAAAAASSSASAAAVATSTGASTSTGGNSELSSTQGTSGSTIWFSVVALLAVVSLGTAAVVMSRRRRSGAGDDQAG